MISSPILHDIIKSELDHNANAVFELCRTIDPVKQSNIFKKDYWLFREARQEQINHRYRQADAVWYFQGQKNDNYYIVHEVKTGNYSALDVFNKYRLGMAGQIWIWSWRSKNNHHILGESYKRQIKLIDIEYLVPMLRKDLYYIYTRLLE